MESHLKRVDVLGCPVGLDGVSSRHGQPGLAGCGSRCLYSALSNSPAFEHRHMKHTFSIPLLSGLLVLAVTLSSVSGVIVTVPAGLNPGDQYRLVFVTDGFHDALSSDIGVYNAFVAAEAAAVPDLSILGADWRAIGSTLTVTARDNTGTNPFVNGPGVPIYGLDGSIIASGNPQLWSGTIANPLNITPTGIVIVIVNAWTGASEDGQGVPGSELGNVSPVVVGFGSLPEN
jgi:hypothetical protein